MKFSFSKEVACYALIYFFLIKYRSRKLHVVYSLKAFFLYTLLTTIYGTRVHKDQIILWRKNALKMLLFMNISGWNLNKTTTMPR